MGSLTGDVNHLPTGERDGWDRKRSNQASTEQCRRRVAKGFQSNRRGSERLDSAVSCINFGEYLFKQLFLAQCMWVSSHDASSLSALSE